LHWLRQKGIPSACQAAKNLTWNWQADIQVTLRKAVGLVNSMRTVFAALAASWAFQR